MRRRPHCPAIAPPALAVLAALAGLLAGCGGSAGPVPRDAFYRLEPPPAAIATPAALPRFPGVAEVRPPATDAVLAQRAIAYVAAPAAGSPATVAQYSYHYWTEPPAQAVAQALAARLRASGLFADVLTPDFRVPPDYEITGRLVRLEQRLGADGASAVVAVELEVGILRRRGMALVLHRTYDATEPAADASVPAAVAAFQQALGHILDRLAADLAAAPPPPEDDGRPRL